jgi:hypothetical protein
MEVSVQLYAPATLPREKSLKFPLDRRLGELQRRSRRNEKGNKSLPLPRIEPQSSMLKPSH